ncbi:MAG: HlyD family efflux transporter periplasmic adaptor subunit [Acidobacteria bacterium]|nr:MAG: HlyD family efflux transporter periplasmic adaptor subunit [Acidobacteriota bacterium]
MRAAETAAAVLLAGLAGWIGLRGAPPPAQVPGAPPDPGEAVVSTGPVEEIVRLTGELTAREAERFTVPLASGWRLQLKWLIDEGTAVRPGDVVARFEPSVTESVLEEAETNLDQKSRELAFKRLEGEQKRLALERELARAQAECDKAEIDASVPPEVVEGREYRQRRLALEKARRKLEDAEQALQAGRLQTAAELFALEIEVADLEDDVGRFRKELASLELRAHRPGIVVHEYHPWWGRKVQEGDRLEATLPVASIPDLSTLEVEAWATETEVARLAPGQKVRLAFDALPGREFTGVVTDVAERGTRRPAWGNGSYFRVGIALDERDEEVMRPGMSARCDVLVRSAEGLPRVPVHMIGRDGARAWVRSRARGVVPVEIVAEGPLLAAVRPLSGAALADGEALVPPGEAPPEAVR